MFLRPTGAKIWEKGEPSPEPDIRAVRRPECSEAERERSVALAYF